MYREHFTECPWLARCSRASSVCQTTRHEPPRCRQNRRRRAEILQRVAADGKEFHDLHRLPYGAAARASRALNPTVQYELIECPMIGNWRTTTVNTTALSGILAAFSLLSGLGRSGRNRRRAPGGTVDVMIYGGWTAAPSLPHAPSCGTALLLRGGVVGQICPAHRPGEGSQ